jgi:hypothetical protein
MAWSRLIFDQIKAFLLDQLEEDGRSDRAKREVQKQCNILAKWPRPYFFLMDSFLL